MLMKLVYANNSQFNFELQMRNTFFEFHLRTRIMNYAVIVPNFLLILKEPLMRASQLVKTPAVLIPSSSGATGTMLVVHRGHQGHTYTLCNPLLHLLLGFKNCRF